MKGSQTRTTLLVLAGAYLLYLAWEMLNTMRKGETEMQPWLSIVFIVFFTLAGLGVFVLAWRARQQEKEQAAKALAAAGAERSESEESLVRQKAELAALRERLDGLAGEAVNG